VVLPVLQRCQLFIDHILKRNLTPGPVERAAWGSLQSAAAKVIILMSRNP
jgi:hypothetical protein